DPPVQHMVLVEVQAVPAGPVAPGSDGPLVVAVGGNDRLERAAVAEQGQHDGHQVGRRLEPVERDISRLGEGAAAGRAAVASLGAAMHADVADPELPACGAVGAVAESVLRVHRRSLGGTVWLPCPQGSLMDPYFSSGYHYHHGSLGCYPREDD